MTYERELYIMKKTTALILVVLILSSMSFAFAADIAEGEKRTVLGANLDEDQIKSLYGVFGIERGDVKELRVNIDQERKYLEGLIDGSKIGSRSYSSIYIETLPAGSGIEVETHNIDWCSKEMYISALSTAGVKDCRVIVAAPFNVSGTAALTGVYLAYEDMSGVKMDELAKQVGAEELTVTAELAEKLGAVDSVEIVNELKLILDETKDMTDDELRAEILNIAGEMGIELTDAQTDKLILLCRSLEKMDPDKLKSKVDSVKESINKMAEAKDNIQKFSEKFSEKFNNIYNAVYDAFKSFFSIFGKKN